MFDAIIAFSLRHRMLVIIMTFILIGGGIAAFMRLPIDAVPDITNNQIQILTKAPALSSPEIERFVTIPLELVVKALPNTVELRSLSRPGLSVVTVVFEDDVDVYFARRLILEKLREVENQFPPGVEQPELGPVSTGLGEIFRYVIRDTTGTYSPMDLRTIQDWIVRRQLTGTEAVAEVNSLGGELKQYQVLVDPEALAGYGLSLREVFTAVTEASSNAGGGYIETGAEQLSVRAVGLATSVEDIRNTVIRTSETGTPLLVGDIATVTTGPALRFGSASQDGKGEVVTGIVMQLKGANARTTINAVKERIEEIRPSLPPGIVIEPYYDREVLVDSTIRTVATNLIEGAALVIGVLLLLLVNLRAGFIVASVIPLSMLFAGILMVMTGQSGNLMSLGALDFGIVVDGSLIIVENVLRVLRERNTGSGQSTSGIKSIVYSASTEVRRAAQFGEIIILVVYLPIITLQGIEGKLFRPMALTVSFALLGALLLSVTYVPVMCSFLLKRQTVFRESPIILFLHRYYAPLLQRVLKARYIVTASAILLVTVAVIGFTRLGGEFIPRLDEGDIAMHLIRLPSVSLTESQKLTTEVEKELMTFDEVRTVVSHTGRAEISTDPMGFELADVFIMLKPRSEWKHSHSKEELIAEMQHRLERIPGIGTQFLQPIEMRMNELIAGARGDVVIKIFGENYEVLQSAVGRIATILRSTQGAQDVAIEQVSGLPQLLIRPDRSALARYGMTINELNTIVAVAVGGETAGEIYEGEKRFDIVVRMADQARSNVEAIRNLPVATPAGPRIPLGSLAAVTLEEGPVQISREEGSRFTTVQANVRGRDVESFVEEIQPIIAEQVQLPPGYSLTYGGQFENLRSASSRLALIVPVALLLIFILLYQTFASMRLALMIFVCIPLALIGGVAALFIAGLPFSISAGVGFIALFGIAVLNGIVMVAAIRKHHTGGMSRREAVLHGADERLRPVITTAALAGFGFLPMLLAHSAGAEVQRPLATVVIGGLISCTLLTLFLLPILYDWFGTIDDNNTNGTHDFSGPTPSPASPTHLPVIALLVLAGLLYGTTAMAQEPLTLQKVVERTLASSPELRQSDALITQRTGEYEAAWAIPATEVFYGNEESPALFTSNLGIRSYGIAQSIEFPLVYTTQSRSTELLVQAAQTSRADVERSLRRRAALAYNDAITTRALLAMADSMIAVTRRFYEASARRREAGEATALETLQASVAVANAERQRQQAEGSFNAALAVLRTLMAEPPDAPLIITEAPGLQAIGLSAEELEQRIAVHPRLQTGSLTVEAARARQRTEVYRNYPGLSLEYAEQTMNDVAGFQSGKIGLTLPLGRWLSGGANKQARAGVMIAEAELESTRRSMLTTARELYIRYTTAREGVSMYQQQILPQAQEAYRIAVRLYEEGDTGYLDVLNAQTQLISTTMIVLQELQAAGQMAIELDYLLGR